jgi:hypothetical protein
MVHRRPRRQLLGRGVIVLGLLATGISADAASLAPAERCTLIKIDATARLIAARYRCEILALVAPEVAPEFCLLVRPGKEHEAAVVRADSLGPCPGTGHALRSIAYTECVPYLGDTACTVAQLRASRDKTVDLLRCRARGVRRGQPPDPDCVAAAEARFAAAFARAGLHGPCGGDPAPIEVILDRCVDLLKVALTCGNGVIDEDEECDGQRFCSPPSSEFGCQISDDPRCCQVGGTGGVCVATPPALETCGEFGGTVVAGYCPDTPCPGDPFPGCTLGACSDPPIPPTVACCQQAAGCQDSTATTTLELRSAMKACSSSGGTNVIGSCAADGRCVRD